MPIQATTAGRCHGGASSCLSLRPQNSQGTYVRGKIHTILTTITVTETSTASQISCPALRPESASRISCSCSPTSENSSALTTKVKICQAAAPSSRVWTLVSSGVLQPM